MSRHSPVDVVCATVRLRAQGRRIIAVGLAAILGSFATGRAATPAADVEIDFLYGDQELFPATIVSATSYCLYAPRGDQNQLGDAQGVISARIRNPTANTTVKVTIAETAYFAESSTEQILPEADHVYWVAPTVRYYHDRLAALKQPVPNLVLKITVEVSGPRPTLREFYPHIVMHSVNDCMWAYQPRGSNQWNFDARYMLAAFVNENSPVIDQEITKYALEKGLVTEFRGYFWDVKSARPTRTANEKEIKAVYETLRALGFKYAALSQASVYVPSLVGVGSPAGREPVVATRVKPAPEKESRVRVQHVRLTSDAMASRQANSIEGAALLTSAYRKMMLHTVVMMAPNSVTGLVESLVGVYMTLPMNPDKLLVIDPQMIGTAGFDAAVSAGAEKFAAAKPYLLPPATTPDREKERYKLYGYVWIDIDEARLNGVLPVPELGP